MHRALGTAAFDDALVAAHRRNLPTYGYGVKGYVLSAIEAASQCFVANVPSSLVQAIVTMGQDLLDQDIVLLAGVEESLEALGAHFELVLITKGDLLHQEQKLARSAIGGHFDRVEIVSDKTAATYRRVLGASPSHRPVAAMVGNSIRSDILPAIEAGAYGLNVPHNIVWDHEVMDLPLGDPLYRQFANIAEATAWLLQEA